MRKRYKTLYIAFYMALMAGSAFGGINYGKTRFMDDVDVGTWSEMSDMSVAFTNGGTYTNGMYTNYYRISGTNLLGRIPLSSNLVCSAYGVTNASNAVMISWERYDGVSKYIIERSLDAGTTWTNWISVSALSTSWTDTGTNSWTNSVFTNLIAAISEDVVIDFTNAAVVRVPDPGATPYEALNYGWFTNYMVTGGYLTVESDPIFTNSVAYQITSGQTGEWSTAYGWGDHSTNGYLTAESDPIFTNSVAYQITSGLTNEWITAYGWGDHSTNGYLTAESDPIFTNSVAYQITSGLTNEWITAYGWGDHSTNGYLTAETDSIFTNSVAYQITSGLTNEWSTAYGWGDHSTAGYHDAAQLTNQCETFTWVIPNPTNGFLGYVALHPFDTLGDCTIEEIKVGTSNGDVTGLCHMVVGDWPLTIASAHVESNIAVQTSLTADSSLSGVTAITNGQLAGPYFSALSEFDPTNTIIFSARLRRLP